MKTRRGWLVKGLAIAVVLGAAAATVHFSTASAKERKPIQWKAKKFTPNGTPLNWELTINSDGTFTKSFWVDGWPCTHTDDDDGNTCTGGLAMGIKGKTGAWVSFSDEGRMSKAGWRVNKSGKHKALADNFDDLAAGKFETTYKFVGKSQGWSIGDILGDLGKVLAVAGPVIAAL